MSDLLGKDIGRYHIVARIGQGGMAEVYKAIDKNLDSEVAIKVIRRDMVQPAQLESILKRFEREAKALARLTHPNIVGVRDYGTQEGIPYLVMEYLTGGTLKPKTPGKPIAWQEAARMLAPIARALEYAHGEGILHRDVKPANILLTKQGQPMLSDFGIAKILDVEGTSQLTGTNVGIGTPEYMAPEQWAGKSVAQTDIYALGVIFYELVTGRKPYKADTPIGLMKMQLTVPLPMPRQLNADLPEIIDQVLCKALAKDPKDRYANMAEFANILEELASGHGYAAPTVLSKPSRDDRTQLSERKRGVKTSVAGEAPGGGAAAILSTEIVQGSGEGSTQPLRRAVPAWVWIAVILLVAAAIALAWTSITNQRTPAERTATSVKLNSLQTVDAATMIAAAWTFTPTVTPTITLTTVPSLTPTPSLTPVPSLTPTMAPGATLISVKDNMAMVWVPAGDFTMGSDKVFENEKPAHKVTLDGYFIDSIEVTNSMYASCVAAGACVKPKRVESSTRVDYYLNTEFANFPVIYVSWNDADTYCKWAGRRLPTEAEWEKAARGSDGRTYPWGSENPRCDLSNFNSCNGDTSRGDNYPLGASPYGAMDMAGNVSEWVADWYSATFYSNSPGNNPKGPSMGEFRVLRGGSWIDNLTAVRSAFRLKMAPSSRGNFGIRCAFTP